MGCFFVNKKKNMDDTTTVSTLTVCLFLLVVFFLFSFLDHQSSLLITSLFDFIPFCVVYSFSFGLYQAGRAFAGGGD